LGETGEGIMIGSTLGVVMVADLRFVWVEMGRSSALGGFCIVLVIVFVLLRVLLASSDPTSLP
jgi:hypothetical protein